MKLLGLIYNFFFKPYLRNIQNRDKEHSKTLEEDYDLVSLLGHKSFRMYNSLFIELGFENVYHVLSINEKEYRKVAENPAKYYENEFQRRFNNYVCTFNKEAFKKASEYKKKTILEFKNTMGRTHEKVMFHIYGKRFDPIKVPFEKLEIAISLELNILEYREKYEGNLSHFKNYLRSLLEESRRYKKFNISDLESFIIQIESNGFEIISFKNLRITLERLLEIDKIDFKCFEKTGKAVWNCELVDLLIYINACHIKGFIQLPTNEHKAISNLFFNSKVEIINTESLSSLKSKSGIGHISEKKLNQYLSDHSRMLTEIFKKLD